MLNSPVCFEESGGIRGLSCRADGWGLIVLMGKWVWHLHQTFIWLLGSQLFQVMSCTWLAQVWHFERSSGIFPTQLHIKFFFIYFICKKWRVWVLPPEKWTSDHIRQFSVRGWFFLVLSLLSLASRLPAALLSRLSLVPVSLMLNLVKKVQIREWRIKSSVISSKCSVIVVVKQVRLN